MSDRIKSIKIEFDPFLKDEDAERLIDRITDMGVSIVSLEMKDATVDDYVKRSKLKKWKQLHNTITGDLPTIRR